MPRASAGKLDMSRSPRRSTQLSGVSRPASSRNVNVLPDPEGPRIARRRAPVVQATSSSKEPRRRKNWKLRPPPEISWELDREVLVEPRTLSGVANDGPAAIGAPQRAGLPLM